MKYRLGAAIAVLATTLFSGGVFAGSTSGKVTAFDYNPGLAVVSGIDAGWQVHKLKHHGFTDNVGIEDPNIFPAGRCRSIAVRWNIGVFQGRSPTYFRKVLEQSALFNCSIEFVRETDANADGSFDLKAVSPTP